MSRRAVLLLLVLSLVTLASAACDDDGGADDPTTDTATTTAGDTGEADMPGADTALDVPDDDVDTVDPDTTEVDTTAGDLVDADAEDADTADTTTPDVDMEEDVVVEPPSVVWSEDDGTDGPRNRWGRQVAWIDASSAYVFGGVDATNSVQGDLWRVDVGADGALSFTEATTQETPSPRYCGCMAYDPVGQTLLLVGGRSFSAFFAETWLLDLKTSTWQQITDSPEAPSRVLGCAMAYAANTGDFILSGGASMAGVSAETWRFDTETATWTQLEATGPAARYDAGMRAVDGGRSLLLFGGAQSGQTGFMADTWRFDTELELWDPVDTTASAATPPGRRVPWMVTSADERFLFVGFGVNGLQPGSALADLWMLDVEQGLWTELAFNGDTPPARGFAPALPGGTGALGVLMGGFDNSNPVGDTWRLEVAAP